MLEASSPDERVLILAPTGRDAVLASQLLAAANIPSLPCLDEQYLFREIGSGAGAAILADEALLPQTVQGLLEVLSREGPWSDLPVIVFTRGGETSDEGSQDRRDGGRGHRSEPARGMARSCAPASSSTGASTCRAPALDVPSAHQAGRPPVNFRLYNSSPLILPLL